MMKYHCAVAVALCMSVGTLIAQPSQLHINGSSGLDKELSSLMNELELSNDQKLALGILLLKYSTEFNYQAFDEGSKTKKYSIVKKKIRKLDKDLKGILKKDQYKVYKKKKKVIRQELKEQ